MRRRTKDSPMVRMSKKLSWALRHGLEKLGLTVTPAGYVTLSELLALREFSGFKVAQIEEIVKTDNKQRFSLIEVEGQLLIRANQGHTIKGLDDAEIYQPITDPGEFPKVYHGTYKKALDAIAKRGLYRMDRTHIHLATGMPGAGGVISGARTNCNVVIEIDLPLAMSDGIPFSVSENQVVLTAGINGFLSNKYFKQLFIDGGQRTVKNDALDLDFVLVLDFEANALENEPLVCQEIIEFPVKIVNVRTLEVGNVFHHYIKPTVVPQLTEFIIGLTGIQQHQVDSGILINDALSLFDSFLAENQLQDKNWIFASYGDWDLNVCLRKEMMYKGLQFPDYFKRWINIRKLMPVRTRDIIDLLQRFSIPHTGKHHSGIDDVDNITKAFVAMLQSGMKLYPEDVQNYTPLRLAFMVESLQKFLKTNKQLRSELKLHAEASVSNQKQGQLTACLSGKVLSTIVHAAKHASQPISLPPKTRRPTDRSNSSLKSSTSKTGQTHRSCLASIYTLPTMPKPRRKRPRWLILKRHHLFGPSKLEQIKRLYLC